MAGTLSEVDEIRRHMAQIRHELHQDVQGVVRGAEATADWRRYVRNYPWVTLGIAFGIGYLIVPRRQKPLAPVIQYAQTDGPRPAALEAVAPAEPAKKKGTPLWKTALGLATPFVLKSAQGYALQFFEQYLAQKMAQQQSPFANLAASFMNPDGGPPGNPGPGPGPNPPGPPRYPG